MLPLQIGQLPPFRGVVGEFVVGGRRRQARCRIACESLRWDAGSAVKYRWLVAGRPRIGTGGLWRCPPPVASRGSGAGELTVGLDVHVAVFVRSRRIRHFVPTTGGPAPQEPHQAADRRHPGGDHRRPHQYLSQPEAPLDFYDPPLRMPKSGQLVHAPRNAHDQLDENGRHGPRACPGDSANYRAWSAARRERPLANPLVAGSSSARPTEQRVLPRPMLDVSVSVDA